jgi:hypothetical protein
LQVPTNTYDARTARMDGFTFLAMMLGTRRSTVTVAAGILHKSGLIEYSRGRVTTRNREGLKDAACECYEIVLKEYVRLGLI